MPIVSQNPQGGGGGGGGGVQVATVTVSSAEILALHTTPVVLVPGVAGNVVMVNGVLIAYLAGATPYTDGGGVIGVELGGSPIVIFSSGSAGFWDQATDEQLGQMYGTNIAPGAGAVGADVILTCDNNPTLGNGTLKVTVSYFLAPTV